MNGSLLSSLLSLPTYSLPFRGGLGWGGVLFPLASSALVRVIRLSKNKLSLIRLPAVLNAKACLATHSTFTRARLYPLTTLLSFVFISFPFDISTFPLDNNILETCQVVKWQFYNSHR